MRNCNGSIDMESLTKLLEVFHLKINLLGQVADLVGFLDRNLSLNYQEHF